MNPSLLQKKIVEYAGIINYAKTPRLLLYQASFSKEMDTNLLTNISNQKVSILSKSVISYQKRNNERK